MRYNSVIGFGVRSVIRILVCFKYIILCCKVETTIHRYFSDKEKYIQFFCVFFFVFVYEHIADN